jgi:hypothetical protein
MRIGNRNFLEHEIQLIPAIAGTREKQRAVIQRTIKRSQSQPYKTRLNRILVYQSQTYQQMAEGELTNKIQIPYPTLFFFELVDGFSVFFANCIILTCCFYYTL